MKNKNILTIMSMFVLVLTLFVVSSVTPFEGPSTSKYIIEYPQLTNAYLNYPFEFYSHVYFDDGTQLVEVDPLNNVTCHIDGYDFTGNVTIQLELDNLYNGIWYTNVPATFFNFIGDGYYTLHCVDNNDVVGIVSIPFNVEENPPFVDDKSFNFDLSDNINIIILVLAILIIVALIYFKLYFFAGLIIGIIGIMLIISKYNFILSVFITIVGFIISSFGE